MLDELGGFENSSKSYCRNLLISNLCLRPLTEYGKCCLVIYKKLSLILLLINHRKVLLEAQVVQEKNCVVRAYCKSFLVFLFLFCILLIQFLFLFARSLFERVFHSIFSSSFWSTDTMWVTDYAAVGVGNAMLPLLLSWSYHVDLTDKNSIRISEATWNLVVGDFKCSFFPLKDFFENIFFYNFNAVVVEFYNDEVWWGLYCWGYFLFEGSNDQNWIRLILCCI